MNYFDFPDSRYSVINAQAIISTLDRLESRISERFPSSGLAGVAGELKMIADIVVSLSEKLKKPFWIIRIFTVVAIVFLISFSAWLVFLSYQLFPLKSNGITEIIQSAESVMNELIFLSLTILFFATLENRLKRKAALKSLHQLRSIAHVIDMHQLTKDPFYSTREHKTTATSPQRTMTSFELSRYLDYCSELLAIISKLAACHVQNLQDSQVLDTVNDVENLTQGLSVKILQKLMILEKF